MEDQVEKVVRAQFGDAAGDMVQKVGCCFSISFFFVLARSSQHAHSHKHTRPPSKQWHDQGAEAVNAKLADPQLSAKAKEVAEKALAKVKEAANDPAMREKAKEYLAKAKEVVSDPDMQAKLKDAATKLAEYAK